MAIIKLGNFVPDNPEVNSGRLVLARNVIPVETGYDPLPSLAPATDPLPSPSRGSGVAIDQSGSSVTFAGTETNLYQLAADLSWTDVSRLTGGDYSTAGGEKWRYLDFADLMIATNYVDDIQKFDVEAGTNFEALGGSPPRARYITAVKDHVVLGNLVSGSTNRSNEVEWSGNGDAEQWGGTAGNAGAKIFYEGGPVQGLVGGEVGYVFQRNSIWRMTFLEGSRAAFQFDEVGRGQGTTAPDSIVNRGSLVYYLGRDGFYELNTASGVSTPISNEIVSRYFLDTQRPGSNIDIIGGVAIFRPIVFWAYVSTNTIGGNPDRLLIYNWVTREWSEGVLEIVDVLNYISPGYNLDNINSFGTLDDLPFSLDSPFWSSGSEILGIFATDNRLSYLTGSPLEATMRTAEFQPTPNGRSYVSGIRPIVDTSAATVAIAAEETRCAVVSVGDHVAQESTGDCPQHAEGRYLTVEIKIPAGEPWTTAEGFEPTVQPAGDQ